MTKLTIYTEKQEFKTSKIQKKTLKKLRSKYGLNVSQFIRNAVQEKIQRDYSKLHQMIEPKYYPF